MVSNLKDTAKNVSYSFLANFVSISISIVMVMFIPRYLSLEDYGKWQLFLFYFSYLGFFHFGWEDGIYLRYAGLAFEQLDRGKMAGQFYGIVVLQFMLVLLAVLGAMLFITDIVKQEVFIFAVLLMPFVNFNNLCNFILRITNCIKSYAGLLITERLSFFLGVVFVLYIGYRKFFYLYYAQVVSIVCTTVIGVSCCKDLLKPSFFNVKDIITEANENLSVGSKLMLANIASMLIVGVVRFGISEGWGVATFGKVSLTLGISNFLMVFISSVSVVLFPILKRINGEQLADVYIKIRSVLTIIIFGMLLCYYPLRSILTWWLPKYADALIYMSVLFPICLFESKMSLLVNNYLQSMRQEKLILMINTCALLFSLLTTFFTVKVFHNLNLAVLSIVFLYGVRCILAEYWMSRLLAISLSRAVAVDILMITLFMITGWLLDSWICTIIYGIGYMMYLWNNRNKCFEIFNLIKSIRD